MAEHERLAIYKFYPGRIVITPGAVEAFTASGEEPYAYLERHCSGDWGEVDAADAAANDTALRHGARLLSAYTLGNNARIWIITEHDRSATTLLTPQES
jgi:hypothetical protein